MSRPTPWYILLDRDGTVIEDRHYLCDPDGVVLLPGAAEGLHLLRAAGCRLALVTNQSGIGRGMYDEAAMHRVNARLRSLLAERDVVLDGIFFCPHAPDAGCTCRKPRPGLFLQAQAQLGVVAARTCVVGDKESDLAFGHAIGAACSLLVRTGYGTEVPPDGADAVVDNLLDAARWILRHCPIG